MTPGEIHTYKMPILRSILFIWIILAAGCSRPSKPLEPQNVWKQVSPAVVRVEALQLNGDRMIGSGFICKIEGKIYILTNKHVVRGAKEVSVGLTETNLLHTPGYRVSRDLDLAIIEIPKDLPSVYLETKTGGINTGEKIYALGFPLGLSKSITQGIVSSQTDKLLQFDAPISSGNSGGPLVDANGSVVGIVTLGSFSGGSEVAQNMNFAIKTGIIPKVQLFNDPIPSFYNAWLELVKIENQLIDGLRDHQVFELREYLENRIAFANGKCELGTNINNLPVELKNKLDEAIKTTLDEPLARLNKRYGSLDNAVSSVAGFLQTKAKEFDQIPELFSDVRSDELLESFTSNQHTNNYFTWDIKPSDISPLLKVSIEFSKAKYEDEAFQITFLYRAMQKIDSSDVTFSNAFFQKLGDSKWVGKRASTRLSYQSINRDSSDEEWVKMYGLSLQRCDKLSELPYTTTFSHIGTSLKQATIAGGGFEGEITSMFEKTSLAPLEDGSVDSAIGLMMNEIAVKKYPDLSLLAFFYICAGDFDKAYAEYDKAYSSFLAQVDPFALQIDNSIYLVNLFGNLTNDGEHFTAYTPTIKKNLVKWHLYIIEKPAYALTLLPAADAFNSSAFKKLSEFEKKWVVFAHGKNAIQRNGDLSYDAFRELVEKDSELNRLYQNCFNVK